MTRALLALMVLTIWACGRSDGGAATQPAPVAVRQLPDRLRVEFAGDLFTEYLHQHQPKPILYPILGPGGACVVRHHPLKTDVPGEPRDHPHHESFWFAHGSVNGIDFWTKDKGAGSIAHARFTKAAVQAGRAIIASDNRWVGPDGKTVCTDQRQIAMWTESDARLLEFSITLRAGDTDVTFGDNKDGTMAIRLRPELQLKNANGTTTASGHAVNSEGVTGPAIWGKRAKWVDYWGEVEGKTIGVAMFDHPSNPRHPTWWMARDYGLFAANPFGAAAFEKKPPRTGDMTIKAGQSATFRYLFVFHIGDAEQARIGKRYESWAGR